MVSEPRASWIWGHAPIVVRMNWLEVSAKRGWPTLANYVQRGFHQESCPTISKQHGRAGTCSTEDLLPRPPGGLPRAAERRGCSYPRGDWQAHGGHPGLCQAGFGGCFCRHAVHQLHGGSCCVPNLCPAELCQPSWVHWEDRVRQLPFGQQAHWGEASSGSAPRHHLQDGGWGASQVRQAPPASCWWLQGPHEHWRHCRDAWGMEVGSQGPSPQTPEEGDEGLGLGSIQQGQSAGPWFETRISKLYRLSDCPSRVAHLTVHCVSMRMVEEEQIYVYIYI